MIRTAAGTVFPALPRQMEALQVIAEWIELYGHAPTVEELAHEIEMASKGGVVRLLRGLADRGWIRHLPYKARGIELLHRPPMPDFSPLTFRLNIPPAPSVQAEMPL